MWHFTLNQTLHSSVFMFKRLSSPVLSSSQNTSVHSKEKKFPSIPQALVLDLCCSTSLRHHPNPRSLLLSLDGSSLCWSPILFFILCCHNPPATLIHSWSLARFWIYYFRGRTISGPGCQHPFFFFLTRQMPYPCTPRRTGMKWISAWKIWIWNATCRIFRGFRSPV